MTEVRKALLSDAQSIAAAEREYIDCPWTAEQIAEEIKNPDALFLTACADGEFAGYASGKVCLDELEISNIAVHAEFRRRGIAQALLDGLISAARARGVNTVFLMVRDGNIAAQCLYRNRGFVEVGRRSNYYREKSDAIIMKLDI